VLFLFIAFELILPVAAVHNEDEILYQARATRSSMKPNKLAVGVSSVGKVLSEVWCKGVKNSQHPNREKLRQEVCP